MAPPDEEPPDIEDVSPPGFGEMSPAQAREFMEDPEKFLRALVAEELPELQGTDLGITYVRVNGPDPATVENGD